MPTVLSKPGDVKVYPIICRLLRLPNEILVLISRVLHNKKDEVSFAFSCLRLFRIRVRLTPSLTASVGVTNRLLVMKPSDTLQLRRLMSRDLYCQSPCNVCCRFEFASIANRSFWDDVWAAFVCNKPISKAGKEFWLHTVRNWCNPNKPKVSSSILLRCNLIEKSDRFAEASMPMVRS